MNINELSKILNEPLVKAEDLKYLRMSKDAPYFADQKYEHIIEQIQKFEETLDADHEVALQLASFGKELTMMVTDIGYQNPDLLYFWGNVNGRPAELIQHINQLNFLIISVVRENKSKPARRIGFKPPRDSEDE